MTHTHTARFDWTSPPLSANVSLHWAKHARVVKDTRLAARLAFSPLGRTGPHHHAEVTLVWIVADHRKRDADNVVPTLKAVCDGLVDAGIVPDDTQRWMTKHMPQIEVRPGATPHIEVTVTAT